MTIARPRLCCHNMIVWTLSRNKLKTLRSVALTKSTKFLEFATCIPLGVAWQERDIKPMLF